MREALLWLVPMALALDVALRYPPMWHPVQGIGFCLDILETRLRALAPSLARTEGYLPDVLCDGEVRAGFVGVVLTVSLTCAMVAALTSLPVLGIFFAIFLSWSGLALGSLLRAGREALAALEKLDTYSSLHGRDTSDSNVDLAYARHMVGRLVSRDLSCANARELYRALAETLAENFNDAFIAPLFWLCVGGPVALWGYKAVSTMDSMWGYRTARWERMGKCAARLDDVLAYIPARLSAFLLWATASCHHKDGGLWPGVAVVRRQAARMASPNAGWPMAAIAWVHGAPMGGPTMYYGEIIDKPHLGPDAQSPWNSARLHALLRHLLCAGLAGGALALICLWLVTFVTGSVQG